ncbi:MAG: hypothetical protein WA709_24950 [Stellaceae bacterium]
MFGSADRLWRDTVVVPRPAKGGSVVIRSRFLDYTGRPGMAQKGRLRRFGGGLVISLPTSPERRRISGTSL